MTIEQLLAATTIAGTSTTLPPPYVGCARNESGRTKCMNRSVAGTRIVLMLLCVTAMSACRPAVTVHEIDAERLAELNGLVSSLDAVGLGRLASVGEDVPPPAADPADMIEDAAPDGLPAVYLEAPGQERLMAQRAAQVDGYRRLRDAILSLRVARRLTVAQWFEQHEVSPEALVLQQVATVRYRHHDSGWVKAHVRMPLESVVVALHRAMSDQSEE